MSARWLWVGMAALGLAAAAGAANRQHLPGWLQHKASNFRSYGKITVFHLDTPLQAPPLTSLDQFPLKQFTYSLYPTASSGADGMVPGDTDTGAPMLLPVVDGMYDHHDDANNPIEFEIIKSDLARLPKAPGGAGLLVYSVLYTGDHIANCTGVVQLLELDKGKLMLSDQISYDCRGGADAEWEASKRRLTVRSANYSLGDKPCCPSVYDSVVFKLDGETVKTGDVTINNQNQ